MDERKETIDLIKQHIKELKKKDLTDECKAFFLRAFIENVIINWNQESMQHNIQVDFKIDRLTHYKIGSHDQINYTKKGCRYDKGEVTKQIKISRTYIND